MDGQSIVTYIWTLLQTADNHEPPQSANDSTTYQYIDTAFQQCAFQPALTEEDQKRYQEHHTHQTSPLSV